MDEFFGIPMGPLATTLVVLVAVLLGALGALAIRNRIFFRLGVRNVSRRRARTALIVLGLMLGTTIISSALVTGDTMSHTIRTSAVQALGKTDVLVSVKGAEVDPAVQLGSTTGVEYFPQRVLQEVEYELTSHDNLIDGVAPELLAADLHPVVGLHRFLPGLLVDAGEFVGHDRAAGAHRRLRFPPRWLRRQGGR